MLRITFEYRDEHAENRWSRQTGDFPSLQECIDWYGLGIDCEYRIVSIGEVGK